MFKSFSIAYLFCFSLVAASELRHENISLARTWGQIGGSSQLLQLILVVSPPVAMLLALLPSRVLIAKAASTPYPQSGMLTMVTWIVIAPVFMLATAIVFGALALEFVGIPNIRLWMKLIGPGKFFLYYVAVGPASGVGGGFFLNTLLRFPGDVAEGRVVFATSAEGVLERWSGPLQTRYELFVRAKDIYEAYARDLAVNYSGASEREHRRAAESAELLEAERLYLAAISLCIEEREIRDEALARYQLGILYHLQARFAEGHQEFTKAISILKSLPKPKRSDRKGLSAACFRFGLLLLEQSQLESAEEQLSESLGLDIALGDWEGQAMTREALRRCGRKKEGAD